MTRRLPAILFLLGIAPSSLSSARAGDDVLDLVYSGHPVKKHLEDMKSGDKSKQIVAGYQLGKFGPIDKRIVEALVEALDRPDSDLRASIVRTLGAHGPRAKGVVPALVMKCLNDKDRDVRLKTLVALAEIREPSKEVVEGALMRLTLPSTFLNAEEKRRAAKLLGELGPDAKAAMPTLRSFLLNDPSIGSEAEEYGRALAKIDPEAAANTVSELVQQLNSRSGGAGALKGLGPAAKDAVPALTKALASSLRREAADALGAIGARAKPAEEALVATLRKETDLYTIQVIARAILEVAPQRQKDVAAVLTDKIRTMNKDRTHLVILLGNLRAVPTDVVPTLVRVLTDGDGAERRVAIRSLQDLGSGAKDAIPALTSLLSSKNNSDVCGAARALGAIGPETKAAIPDLERAHKILSYREDQRVIDIALCLIEQKARPEFLRVLEKDMQTVTALEKVAEEFGNLGAAATPFVPTLAKELGNKDAAGRRAIAKTLGKIGPGAREAVPALTKALADRDPVVRVDAANSLGSIGADAKGALPTLRQLENDSFDFVRQAASAATKRIQASTKVP